MVATMNYYDENAPFELWARKWLKHKCIGMSFVYGRTLIPIDEKI